MSVYRPSRKDPKTGEKIYTTAVYQADFIAKSPGRGNYRVRRSTGQTDKRAAKRVVARWKELAALGELDFDAEDRPKGMTLNEACWRFWEEVAQHQRSASDTAVNLEHISRLIGRDRLFVDITSADIADAARRRAGEPRAKPDKDGNPAPPVALSTVNRQIIVPFRTLWRRANRVWKPEGLGPEPIWGELMMEESEGRSRTLTDVETEIFWREMREDFRPLFEFGVNRGLRLQEMVIKRKDLDLPRRECTIRIAKKKGGVRSERLKLSDREMALFEAATKDRIGEYVFTYEVQRGKLKGARAPITLVGLKTFVRRYFKALRARHPGLFIDFVPHDLRHDFATRLLRSTGNLELVRKALRHADIQSTRRYAHVTGDDVSEAIEDMSGPRAPRISPEVRQN